MSQSAATTVFAIPELLEMILLQVSNSLPRKHNKYTHAATDANVSYAVVHQLHALRRVNCTFNREIARQNLLAQRMLLTPTPKHTAQNDVVHALRPLRWFLDYTGLGEMSTYTTSDFSDGHVSLPTLRTHDLAASLRPNFMESIANEEATWKKLPLLEVPVPTEFGIIITLNIKYAIRGPRPGGVYKSKDLRCYEQEVEVCYTDGLTLGDFWSYLMGYVKMDTKEHLKNFKEWQTREAIVDWEGCKGLF